MQKTSSHIEVVDVSNVVYPQPTIVRPPANLKVVRCTVIFQSTRGQTGYGYLSTVSDQNELNCLIFQNQIRTATAVPPAVDLSETSINTFVFDRLGVGYMTDNFYVSSDGNNTQFIFIWEGINQGL
jgi:hypothetical protein